MEHVETTESLEIHGLIPEPAAEWHRLLRFVGFGPADKAAMSRTVEPLLARANEMVVGTYDHLLSVPETAAVLGWESGADEEHLAERRRFFAVWLARVLGMDTSDEFAAYLFRAGKYHAAHGPRHIHVPPAYVTTSIGLMGAAFARALGESGLPGAVIAPALAGWNKFLSVQLHLMDMGYRAAIEFDRGEFPVGFALFGRLRLVAGQRTLTANAAPGETMESLLRRFFNYLPELRADCLRPVWHSHEKDDSAWVEVYESYAPAPGGWRFLLNGRNAAYDGGFAAAIQPHDTISIFPPAVSQPIIEEVNAPPIENLTTTPHIAEFAETIHTLLWERMREMELGGYADNVAHVDLTSGSVEYKGIPEEWARKYIGARGLGVRYVFEAGPTVEPLSPDNILCFMNGPLTGTAANMSGRMAIVTKSPLTGTVTDSHHGGWSAARLRWAGFDGLIFKGKADTPVYAYIEDGKVELRDASAVWGMSVHETVKHFQAQFGEKDLTVITIGPAGEHLVRFASWVNENDRASGRGGTGCVGGAKNLKAVVIKAKKVLPKPANKEAWKKAHDRALAVIMDEANITSPRKGGLSLYGTNVLMNITNTMGALPSWNGRVTGYGDECENLSGEHVYDHILVNNPTCHACPVACKKEVELKDGMYKGLRMESVEYESAWALGANSGHHDINAVVKMIDQCNDYGMDTIELGNAFSTYMEIAEKGYLNGHPPLAWGDWPKMIELTEMIAYRQGVGDALAEGPARFAANLGHPEVSNTVKGQAIPAYDPRGIKGMGIAYATSNRGACHLRAYTPAAELNIMPFQSLKADPLEWDGKGKLVKAFQDIHAFSDSLDLCKFSAFAQGVEEYTQQYAAFVGLPEFTVDDMLKTGERIYNLERYYNNLAGFAEGSDYLPHRFTHEASTEPGNLGHVCELDLMLAEYYGARGWKDGVVTDWKLQELEVI